MHVVVTSGRQKCNRLLALSAFVSGPEASGWSPDEAAEYTGGISLLSDAITPVVTMILCTLHLHMLPSLVQRRYSRVTVGSSLFSLQVSLV